jgi:hypothetical protein
MRWLALVLGLFVGGCQGAFGSAVQAYDHGLYPDALAQLRALEQDARTFGTRDRARYALYRGLAHLALGDRDRAVPWLARAREAALAGPVLLSDDDMGRLTAAWTHLPTGPVLRSSSAP